MTERENYLRCVEFRGPRWIPCVLSFSPATWHKYREDLEDVVLRHPLIFGPYQKGSANFDDYGPAYREGELYTDNWGCVWNNAQGGMEGVVVGHPLDDWAALDTYTPPDSLTKYERGDRPGWDETEERIRQAKVQGKLARGGGDRFFERLHFLRGYENLMIDFAEDAPQLPRLIQMVLDNNMKLLNKWKDIKVDVIHQGDDLGTQTAPMVSPRIWKKYLLPGYQAQFKIEREAGAHPYLHSDGRILDLMDDLIEAGLSIINPQVGANGIDNLSKVCKGRVCIHLDLDRQQIMPFGTPQEIRDHVREAVEKLGSPKGGLMLSGEAQPIVPLANIEALAQAMEQLQVIN